MTMVARFLPQYPKRVDVADGLTKREANGVLTLGFDYANSEFGAELQQAVETTATNAALTSADREAVAVDAAAAAASAAEAEISAQNTAPSFDVVADAEAATVSASKQAIITSGYNDIGIGGVRWIRTTSEPSNGENKIRSTDRYLPDGSISSSNGGWWIQSEGSRRIYPEMFGARGDGSSDDTGPMQLAFAHAGRFLFLPRGRVYKVSGTLTAAAGLVVEGRGAKILSNDAHRTIIDASAGGVNLFGFEIEGAGASSVNSLGIPIKVNGTTNASAAPTYVNGFIADDLYIHDFGNEAFDIKYLNDFWLRNNRIEDGARSGVECIGAVNGFIYSNSIKHLSPGVTGDAYGIAVTRDAVSTDLVQRPRSENIRIIGNNIDDNSIYCGINTHAGLDITISQNRVKNCRVPVDIVSSSLNGVDDWAAINVVCSDNILTGNYLDPCIRAVPSAANTIGSPVEWGKGLIIKGNVCRNGGNDSDALTGAILVQDSLGAVIEGNTVIAPKKNGILFFHTNRGFSCLGNTIINPHSNSDPSPMGIQVNDSYNVGTIIGNTLIKDATQFGTVPDYLCEYGVFENAGKINNLITVGPNTIQGGWTTDYSLSTGPQDPHTESQTAAGTTSTSSSSLAITVSWKKPFSSVIRVSATLQNSVIGSKPLVAAVTAKSTTGATVTVRTADGTNFSAAVDVSVDVIGSGW